MSDPHGHEDPTDEELAALDESFRAELGDLLEEAVPWQRLTEKLRERIKRAAVRPAIAVLIGDYALVGVGPSKPVKLTNKELAAIDDDLFLEEFIDFA